VEGEWFMRDLKTRLLFAMKMDILTKGDRYNPVWKNNIKEMAVGVTEEKLLAYFKEAKDEASNALSAKGIIEKNKYD
jgi:hypothetical protein